MSYLIQWKCDILVQRKPIKFARHSIPTYSSISVFIVVVFAIDSPSKTKSLVSLLFIKRYSLYWSFCTIKYNIIVSAHRVLSFVILNQQVIKLIKLYIFLKISLIFNRVSTTQITRITPMYRNKPIWSRYAFHALRNRPRLLCISCKSFVSFRLFLKLNNIIWLDIHNQIKQDIQVSTHNNKRNGYNVYVHV